MRGQSEFNPIRYFSNLCRRQQSRFIDIRKMIYVDSNVLNYSTFYPGKMLGSTLSVGNLSDCEQIVELSVDSNNLSYQKAQIREKFENVVLPFSVEPNPRVNPANDTIVNSEAKHEAWYIENPVSKELTKRITLKLGPKAEQEFIIAVRSPLVQNF